MAPSSAVPARAGPGQVQSSSVATVASAGRRSAGTGSLGSSSCRSAGRRRHCPGWPCAVRFNWPPHTVYSKGHVVRPGGLFEVEVHATAGKSSFFSVAERARYHCRPGTVPRTTQNVALNPAVAAPGDAAMHQGTAKPRYQEDRVLLGDRRQPPAHGEPRGPSPSSPGGRHGRAGTGRVAGTQNTIMLSSMHLAAGSRRRGGRR